MRMFEVIYRERNGDDVRRKRIEGLVEALVRRDFESQGCQVLAIIPQKEGGLGSWMRRILMGGAIKFNVRFGVSTAELALFCEVLKALYASGVPMLQSLQMVIEETPNPWLRKRLAVVLDRLRDGADIHAAMSDPRCAKAFPPLMRETIRTGEINGRLDRSLDRLAEIYKRAAETRRETISALIYPGLAFLVFIVVCSVIAVLVPNALNDAAGPENLKKIWSEIPVAIRILFYLREHWWYLLAPVVAIGGLVVLVTQGMRYRATRLALTRWQRKVPVIGGILYQFALVRFLDLLAANNETGIQIAESLDLIQSSVGDALIEDSLGRMRGRILASGSSLTAAIGPEAGFPGLIRQMIRAGEESGKLTEVLTPITQFYGGQAKAALKRALDLTTPVMIILLGSVIGPVVAGTYVTLMKLQELQITGFGG